MAILSFGQLAWAQGNNVHTCKVETPPTLNGAMDAGEWTSQCTYDLQLKGVDKNPGDETDPPPDKPMTLFVLRDSANVYLGFQWNHDPAGAGWDEYGIGLGFDFNANGVWEDTDHDQLGASSVHTIDDALLLVYLGRAIGEPNPPGDAWVKIYIPVGLYILSWGDKNDDEVFSWDAIGGPDAIPFTIYHGVDGPVLDGSGNPVTFPYGVGVTGTGPYTYTMEIAVPIVLFHSPAGFGFLVSHNGDAWTWPTIVQPEIPDDGENLNEAESARLLGKLLGDLSNPIGLLDLGDDLDAVGGAMASVNKVSLVMPWIAALAVLGIVVAIAVSRKRRT